MRTRASVAAAGMVGAWATAAWAQPLSSAFTYQGELRSGGVPATGPHDLRFRLYDAASGGSQLGPELCLDDISPLDGAFTAQLDFGAQFQGSKRFLEIDVRVDAGEACAAGAGYVTLPRQALSATPHASFALSAGSLNGQPASFYTDATNLSSGTLPGARLGGTYAQALSLTNPANAYSGSGAGLVDLSATSLSTGTVSDARLSSNVAFKNADNTFTGLNSFVNRMGIGTSPTTFATLRVQGNQLRGVEATSQATNGTGVHGAGILFGVRGVHGNGAPASGPGAGVGVYGESDANYGVVGLTVGTTTSAAGIWGAAAASTGPTAGGYFTNPSPDGAAIRAFATASGGNAYGVNCTVVSPTAYSAYFHGGRNYFEGDTGIGTSNPLAKLHVLGNARVDGTQTVFGPLSVTGATTLTGALSAQGGITLPTTTRSWSSHASRWNPTTSGTTYSLIFNGHAIFGTTVGQAVNFQMPIDLPDGASITTLTVYYTDNDATNDINFTFGYANHTTHGSFSSISPSQVSSGANAAVRTVTYSGFTHIVDNDVRALFVGANWTVPATTNTMRVGNVLVTYTITTPLP